MLSTAVLATRMSGLSFLIALRALAFDGFAVNSVAD